MDSDVALPRGSNSHSKIFLNRSILDPAQTPTMVVGRELQRAAISAALKPALDGARPWNLLVHGPPGTGKTACIKVLLEDAAEKTKNFRRRLVPVRVTCTSADSGSGIYEEILARITGEPIRHPGMALHSLKEVVHARMEETGGVFVVVLDEADLLPPRVASDVVYDLTRVSDSLKQAQVTVIAVANRVDNLKNMDQRTRSGFAADWVAFPRYTQTELESILADRVRRAFHPAVVSESAIQCCAALVAGDDGDARRALKYLGKAADRVDDRGESLVTDWSIRQVVDEVKSIELMESISGLGPHQHLLLRGAVKGLKRPDAAGWLSTGQAYALYAEECAARGEKPKTRRAVSAWWDDLAERGIMSAQVVAYENARGRGYKVTPKAPLDLIEKHLGVVAP